MNSVTEAKKNLNKEERKYSDVDAKDILRTLSIMAELQMNTEKNGKVLHNKRVFGVSQQK